MSSIDTADRFLAECVRCSLASASLPTWPESWNDPEDAALLAARAEFHGIALLLAPHLGSAPGWPAPLCEQLLSEARLEAAEIPQRNRASSAAARAAPPAGAAAVMERIAFILPRVSARLPFRSDCLIQAIAAQNWLSAKGLAKEIRIGVEKADTTGFGAHPWLVHGETIVTGGDIGRYHVLLTAEPRRHDGND